ncbi:MAG: hypothetical protein BWK78_01540 [Thiotrichaceae bacterium IS1]|nr:MAG: hypothetical protein BWK78_01540 [Thiotrichaceae bacterium IS1]
MNSNESTKKEVVITFEGVSVAEQNKLAQELSDKLLTEAKRQVQSCARQDIRVDVRKADSGTMDVGSIIDISFIIGHLPETVVAHLIVEFFFKHGLRYAGKFVVVIVCRVRNKTFKLMNTQEEPKLLEFLKQCLTKDSN